MLCVLGQINAQLVVALRVREYHVGQSRCVASRRVVSRAHTQLYPPGQANAMSADAQPSTQAQQPIFDHGPLFEKVDVSLDCLRLTGFRWLLQPSNNDVFLIRLNGVNLNDTDIIVFSRILPFLSKVEKLELAFNVFGDAGASALADAVEVMSNLRELVLIGNNIGPNGEKELCAVAARLPQLKMWLLLSAHDLYTPFTDPFGRASVDRVVSTIAQSRGPNTSLKDFISLFCSFMEMQDILITVHLIKHAYGKFRTLIGVHDDYTFTEADTREMESAYHYWFDKYLTKPNRIVARARTHPDVGLWRRSSGWASYLNSVRTAAADSAPTERNPSVTTARRSTRLVNKRLARKNHRSTFGPNA